MPKISVIVPVYNTEKYLNRCIDSILAQTFTDFELLLIDDGSKDNSGTICDEYAAKDSRVRVFHKENGGVSSARKLGLDNAQGEWITFVDSDDRIDVSYLYFFIDNLKSKIDLIVTSASKDKSITKEEYIKGILMRKVPPSVWGKLYRKQIIKDAFCLPRQLYWGEDLISNVLVGLNIQEQVLLRNIRLYHYDINETSVTLNRRSSIEYEEYFLKILKSKMGGSLIEYKDALNFTELYIIEDLIVCKQRVDYDLMWIKDLRKWGKTQKLTFRQKIVLSVYNNVLCRYILAFERRLRKCLKFQL